MLQVRSAVGFDEIEPVLRAAAQRHNSTVLVISHLATLPGGRDAFSFTLGHTKLYSALLAADMRFAVFLPCRVAAWKEADGVVLEALSPVDYCRLLGRSDLESLVVPLERDLRDILEDAAAPMTMSARTRPETSPSAWGATEDQVNMRMALPQRIDCRGTKVEEEGGTGSHDAPGG